MSHRLSFAGLAVCSLLAGPAFGDDAALRQFVSRHCMDCHSGDGAEAGFALDALTGRFDDEASFHAWRMVLDRVGKAEMPPSDADQPAERDRLRLVAELKESLVAADRRRQRQFGRSGLRRLSRVEYAHSLKDLLALPHLELAEMLPPDGLAHGYAKSAVALDFSHVTVQRYLEVADHALRLALADSAEPAVRRTIRCELAGVDGVRDTLQTLYVQLKHTSGMPLVGRQVDPTLETYRGNFATRKPGYVKDPLPHLDGVATFMNNRLNHDVTMKRFMAPQTGEYLLRVRGFGVHNDRGKLVGGARTETVAFYTETGRLLGRCDLPPDVPTTSEVRVRLTAGERVEYLAVSVPNKGFQLPGKDRPIWKRITAYGIGLQAFEMEGPLGDWPPESHRRLFGDLPLRPSEEPRDEPPFTVVAADSHADAERLLRTFAERAYRRPLRDGDLDIPLAQTRARLDDGETFVESLLAGYRAVLTSPQFLLLMEDPGTLDAWALASRLSLFLTNSPPDDELRAAAASGTLLTDAGLREQTDRLLDDARSGRFVEHFLDHWLDLRHIALTEPDENLYPEYSAYLGESMVEETRAFFAAMLADNLGASHVVDSDFLTINQRLAELYGIDGVHGSHMRRVELPAGSVRGGLLTQASLLKITANGTSTSPVVRGTFALTKLLGDPPPPPPPSVPAIEADLSGAVTIRDLLAKHRGDAACASCHAKIDPPGFALESFDVMGGFRDRYRKPAGRGGAAVERIFNGKPARFGLGLPVDCAGMLPDGSEFADIHQFRAALLRQEDRIARNLLEQFVVYATGTPVGLADEQAVAAMMERLETHGYGVRSMVHEVVQSELFRRK